MRSCRYSYAFAWIRLVTQVFEPTVQRKDIVAFAPCGMNGMQHKAGKTNHGAYLPDSFPRRIDVWAYETRILRVIGRVVTTPRSFRT